MAFELCSDIVTRDLSYIDPETEAVVNFTYSEINGRIYDLSATIRRSYPEADLHYLPYDGEAPEIFIERVKAEAIAALADKDKL